MKRANKLNSDRYADIRKLRVGLSLTCLLLFVLLMFLGACSQTEVEERPTTGGEGKEVDATFRMNVLSSNSPSSRSLLFTGKETKESVDTVFTPSTRATNAMDKTAEDNISNLWVAQYDDTGKLYSQYFESGAFTTNPSGGMEVNLKLKTSAACRIYFIVNAGDLESFITGEAVLKTYTKDFAVSADGFPAGSLGMTGLWSGAVTDAGITSSVDLVRQAAKIAFKYTIGNANGFSFTPTSVTLNNVPGKSQFIEPDAQLASVSYKNYTGIVDNTSATMYWYLPENKAGIVNGANAVSSEKEKVGTGVTNATYIEIQGTAIQDGVTYENVSVKLYPGGDATHMTNTYNNYNVSRNCAYNMTITLTGIDFADKRVTVGKVPDIINPDNLDAAKGSSKEVQITARPGVQWSFMLPTWLSAMIGSTSAGAGAEITYNGPAKITFTAVSANPSAEERSDDFTIDGKVVTVKQNGSVLAVNNPGQMDAAVNSVSTNAWVNATKGLAIQATISGANWLSFASPLATEATGANQDLTFKAVSSNPSKNTRQATVVVKGGNSISNGSYLTLSKNVTVTQAGSTVTGSSVDVAATPVSNASVTFGATPGLTWTASTGTAWIAVGTTSGSNTAASNTVTYSTTATNPGSAKRAGTITVTAGGQADSPTGTLTVNQAGSTLAVSGAATIPNTGTQSASSTFTATQGLSWAVSKSSLDWLTLSGTTSGTNNTTGSAQSITYSAPVNPSASVRSGTITVKAGNAVSGTDAGLTKTIAVSQAASSLTVSANVNPLAATSGASGTYTLNGTSGLSFSVANAVSSWLTLTGTTTGTTNGGNQTFTYKTASVNPNSSERSGNVTVTAGNISKAVAIRQSGSTFSATSATAELANTGSGSVTGKVSATTGLPWTVSPTTNNGITVSPTSGTGNATLTFTATKNTSGARTGTFTVSVTGASPVRTASVTAKQAAGMTAFDVEINQSILQSYYTQMTTNGYSWTTHPPFNADGTDMAASHGITNVVLGSSAAGSTLKGSYLIQVQRTQKSDYAVYSTQQSYCNNLTEDGFSDWRLPTQIELHAMYKSKAKIEAGANATAFLSSWYWSSSVWRGNASYRCLLGFTNGGFDNYYTNANYYVRCVRDK
ncbi:BACON domain-containing protein [Parabacteroides chinchillae]